MKRIPIVLFGFGNVGQALAQLLSDNQGYEREGVRLVLDAVFDRKGGVRTSGQDLDALVDAKRTRGSVTSVDGAEPV